MLRSNNFLLFINKKLKRLPTQQLFINGPTPRRLPASWRFLLALIISVSSFALRADTTYVTAENFLSENVGAESSKPQFLWLDKTAQTKISAALGHPYPQARLRYWRANQKTVWILDEIGKEYPITAGFVVADKHIQHAQVLVYRESRGMEIHFPAFLTQFIGAYLDGDRLSKKIDGITGATLSVDAMQRMARTALVLNDLANTP